MRGHQADDLDLDVVDDMVADAVDDRPSAGLVVARDTRVPARHPAGTRDLAPADILAGQRARRLPFLATGATAGIGTAAWGCAEAVTALGQPAAAGEIVLGTWIGTAVALPVLRIVFRHGIPDGWRRRWWVAGAGGALWVDAVAAGAAAGPGLLPWFGGLALGAAALSARWMDEHEVPQPRALPAPAPLPELPAAEPEPERDLAPLLEIPMDRGSVLARRWQARIASGKKADIPGSLLTGRVDLPNATRWIVELDPDAGVTFDEVLGKRAKLALKLETRASNIVMEQLGVREDPETGELAEDGDNRFELTIVTRDLLRGGVKYQGPRYHQGRIPMGLFADGTGEPEWIAYDNTGAKSGLVAGGQGSGKSALLAQIGMAYKASGEWFVMFGDGDTEGGSSPLLNELADDVAFGIDEVAQQLAALEEFHLGRSILKGTLTRDPVTGRAVRITDPDRQPPLSEILPSPDYRGIVWILDEYHFLGPLTPRIKEMARILRKYGGGIIAASQSLLAADWGNDTAFRGMLAMGNFVALRSGNKSESHTVGNLTVSPTLLPEGGGYAFCATGGRLAMFRAGWEQPEVMHDLAKHLPDAQLDLVSRTALERHRPPRVATPASALADREARLEAFLAGASEPPATASAEPPARTWSVGGVCLPDPAKVGANVVQLRPRTAEPDARPAPDPATLAPGQRAVHDALVALAARHPGQPVTNAQIIAETGLHAPAVSKALGRLVDLGLAQRLGQGTHRPPTPHRTNQHGQEHVEQPATTGTGRPR